MRRPARCPRRPGGAGRPRGAPPGRLDHFADGFDHQPRASHLDAVALAVADPLPAGGRTSGQLAVHLHPLLAEPGVREHHQRDLPELGVAPTGPHHPSRLVQHRPDRAALVACPRLVRMGHGVQPGDEATEGVTDEDVGRGYTHLLEQRAQLLHRAPRVRCRPRVAGPNAGAVVGEHPGERGHLLADRDPGIGTVPGPGDDDHGRAALARVRHVEVVLSHGDLPPHEGQARIPEACPPLMDETEQQQADERDGGREKQRSSSSRGAAQRAPAWVWSSRTSRVPGARRRSHRPGERVFH